MICKLTHPCYDCYRYRYCYWFHTMLSVAVQRSVAATEWPDFLPKYTASNNDEVDTLTNYLWVSQLEFMQQMRCMEQNRRADPTNNWPTVTVSRSFYLLFLLIDLKNFVVSYQSVLASITFRREFRYSCHRARCTLLASRLYDKIISSFGKTSARCVMLT